MNPSAEFLNALTWSLVHFLWQGAAIAALAAAFMYVFRSPATRYLVGVAALALMLASFAVTFSVLRDSAVNGAETSPLQLPAHVSADTWMPDVSAPLTYLTVAAERDFLWVARAWLVGVSALALRIVFGLLMLEFLRRRNLVALPAPLVQKFTALQERLGIQRFIRYCQCQRVRVPAVIGFFRPIVLIPVRALTGLSAEQLEAVVAHELGHIKRFDVAVNFVQVIAETLFFFHPAVWWLNKRIRADREDCCDDVAVAASGGSLGYAKALATMATWRDAPRFAMAATGSPLAARVSRLLGMREGGDGRTTGVFAASIVLVSALLAGAVSLGLVKPAQAAPLDQGSAQLVELTEVAAAAASEPEAPRTAPAPVAAPTPSAAPEPVASPEPRPAPRVAPAPTVHASPASPANPPSPVGPASPAVPANPPVKTKPPRDVTPAAPAAPAAPRVSYIEEMQKAGFDDLDVDDLIALKIHGVTPEYLKEVRALGFTPDAEQVIALKVQDVSPAFVKSMRELGFTPDTEKLISMKVHDVTPEYRHVLEAAGFKMDVERLIEAKVMDITPEFIAKAQKHGFKDLSIDKLIQLKNADVL